MAADHDPARPGADTTTPAEDPEEKDRTVLRRALRAGTRTFAVVAGVTVVANLLFGGDGAAALVWVMASFTVGALVVAGWLVLALLLDMIAGHTPSRRRSIWTAVAFGVAFISPILPAAALLAASGGA